MPIRSQPFWFREEAAPNAMAADAGDRACGNAAAAYISVAISRITGSDRKNIVTLA